MKPTTLVIFRLGELHNRNRFCFIRDYFLGNLSRKKACKGAYKILSQAHPDAVVEASFCAHNKRLIVAVEVLQ